MQMHKHRPVTGSAPCIEQLAASGALLIGKSNLHEIGVGMTGLNTRHGTTRNPHDPRCYTGGSSSGSAAAVASGLCPFALGEHCYHLDVLRPLFLLSSSVRHTFDAAKPLRLVSEGSARMTFDLRLISHAYQPRDIEEHNTCSRELYGGTLQPGV